MVLTKKGNKIARVAAMSVMSFGFSFMSHYASGASALYFDNNGNGSGYGTATNGVYNWDTVAGTSGNNGEWATASGGGNVTGTWTQGSAAVFYQTASPTTIDVSNDEQVANQAAPGGSQAVDFAETTASLTMHIAQTPSTSGDLNIGSVAANFYIATGTSTLIINAPIVGTSTGQVQQHGNGILALYGINTFGGGMEVTGGQQTYYNNSASFGTGNIIVGGGTSNAILSGATSQVTIPNNWQFNGVWPLNLVGGNGTIATPGTIFSGNFPLPTGLQNFETSNTATNVDEISGVISGGSGSNVEFSDRGIMILAGANTYTGTTLVTSSVNAPVTLVLAAANTIASSSQVIMNGGILNPDGINQSMGSTTMALTGTAVTSVIDYSVGAAEIDFANSSSVAWTAGDILNLASFTAGVDFLRFDSGPGGLTSAQLAQIEYDGLASTLGTAVLDANGYVEFPEPASLSMLGLGAICLLARRRK